MFSIAKRTDYGLMALSYLAEREEGEAVASRDIARRFRIPAELLAKTLQILARNGIVELRSGPRGGLRSFAPAGVHLGGGGHPGDRGAHRHGGLPDRRRRRLRAIREMHHFYPMERIQRKVTDLLEGMTLQDMVGAPAGEIR